MFKKSLIKYFATQKKVPVFFDRNYRTPHYQIHVIPIPSNYVERTKQKFLMYAEEKKVPLTEIPDTAELDDILRGECSYFYLEIVDYRFIHTVNRYFPLQFAREVLAHEDVLNLPERKEWMNCQDSKEEEGQNAERFRNGYKPYDFNA